MVSERNELKVFQKVALDEEGYNILREQKKEQKKSMMRIIKDLLIKNYGLPKMQNTNARKKTQSINR
jgi:hypothetical protein